VAADKIVVTAVSQPNGSAKSPPEKPVAGYRNKTWREAEGQREATVRLDRLPANLNFPESFPEPITYDPARKVLKYRGLMFSGSYAYLRKLSADPAYLAALDQLFIATSCPGSKMGRWVVVLGAVVAVALAVFAIVWSLR
jgi:hypothetical protein